MIKPNKFRTHTCGQLREEHAGQDVTVSGWVHRVRDFGGITFVDLRDHYGITQVVFHPESFAADVHHFRLESVLGVSGQVVRRSPETVNPKIATGHVEVIAKSLSVYSKAETMPFNVADQTPMPEHIRLKNRFVDLRTERMHANIMLRNAVIRSLRQRMWDLGFNEFQTPILTASSPEGARDFLVPSRMHPGKFYALPQAPQQFKQLLMVSGFDRYFQIAPCFRDEDSRADRSPGEFYQLDLEMSFATQDDIFAVVEEVVGGTFEEFTSFRRGAESFPRITYSEALRRFGCDKPDLRNPLELQTVTEAFRGSEFKAFAGTVEKGGAVLAIRVPGHAAAPRAFHDRMITFAQSVGSKGLAYFIYEEGQVKSPIAKFLSEAAITSITAMTGAMEGDVIYFICDQLAPARKIGSQVLAQLGEELNLIDKQAFRFCWVVDYPMFEYDEENRKVEFSHNPFSMPQGGMEALLTKDPLDILAYQYDLVCNGIELSSGAIRNHLPDVMYKAFEIAGYGPEVVDTKFAGMINAFRHGAPPHGGIAPGVDRMVMLITGEKNIREIIAFPLNQQAQDMMMNAPSEVSTKQLRELHINLKALPPKI